MLLIAKYITPNQADSLVEQLEANKIVRLMQVVPFDALNSFGMLQKKYEKFLSDKILAELID